MPPSIKRGHQDVHLRASDALADSEFVDQIRDVLTEAVVVHIDESGLRVAGKLHWVHVATTGKYTLIWVHPKRERAGIYAGEVMASITGIAVHDAWAPYDGSLKLSGVRGWSRPIWASAALPGAAHDLTAARIHAIIAALSSANVMTFADKAYQGAAGTVRTPFKRHRYRPEPSRRQKAVNRSHARIRARGERANATLKTWKVLAKLRCCSRRATVIVQAILALHHVEADRYAR